jgi:hypothetical protein
MHQVDSCFPTLETVFLVERAGARDRLSNRLAGWTSFEYGWESDCDHGEAEAYEGLIRHRHRFKGSTWRNVELVG